MAKTPQSFGHSDCKRVNIVSLYAYGHKEVGILPAYIAEHGNLKVDLDEGRHQKSSTVFIRL